MKHYQIQSDLSHDEILRLVEMGEQGFVSQLEDLCGKLMKQKDLHFLGLTGPTCSGKTTSAELLTDAFEKNGTQVHVISLDDFYYDNAHLQELTRKKGLTKLDYDSEDTIAVELLRSCVESLRAQKRTQLPKFNFTTGMREAGEVILPSEKDLFLFEGIQVLYPKVDQILRSQSYQSIHIAPQSAVEIGGECFLPNEIRLMRRLVYRCDYSIDSTMPYEIGILKPFLEEILPKMPKDNEFAGEANRILSELRDVQPLSAELIPEKSLYKEFV